MTLVRDIWLFGKRPGRDKKVIKALLFAKDQKTLRYSVSFPTSVASATSQKSPDGECLVLQQAVQYKRCQRGFFVWNSLMRHMKHILCKDKQ